MRQLLSGYQSCVSVCHIIASYESPDNTAIYRSPVNTALYRSPDNTALYRSPDGTALYRSPDYTPIYRSPDDTASSNHLTIQHCTDRLTTQHYTNHLMTLHCGQWHCIWSSPLQCPPVPLQPHSGLRAARAASDMTHCQCISSVNCHRHHRGLRTAAWLGNACEDRCRTAKYLSVFNIYNCMCNLSTQLDLFKPHSCICFVACCGNCQTAQQFRRLLF